MTKNLNLNKNWLKFQFDLKFQLKCEEEAILRVAVWTLLSDLCRLFAHECAHSKCEWTSVSELGVLEQLCAKWTSLWGLIIKSRIFHVNWWWQLVGTANVIYIELSKMISESGFKFEVNVHLHIRNRLQCKRRGSGRWKGQGQKGYYSNSFPFYSLKRFLSWTSTVYLAIVAKSYVKI